MPSIIQSPGVVWHKVRSRDLGSTNGLSSSIVLCQKLPPRIVKRPGSVYPYAEQAELGVGAADDDRGPLL